MGKKKVKSKTTPIVSEPMQAALLGPTGYQSKVTDFLAMDPHQFVAPASPLQQQAFANASNLGGYGGGAMPQQQPGTPQQPGQPMGGNGFVLNPAFLQSLSGWQPYMQNAMGMAQQAGQGPASQVTAQGYNPYQFGQAPQAGRVTLGNAPQMGAADAGAASEFGGAQLGPVTQAQAAGIDPTVNAQAATADWQGILEGGGINQYMNPANEAYVNSTLANYDQQAAEQRAAQRAAQAGSRAFGGSRAGIEMGAFDAATGRQRAQTEGELRTQAFRDATNIGLSEAARKQNLGQFNAGQQQQVNLTNAAQENARRFQLGQFAQQTGMYNADVRNQFGLQQGAFGQEAGLASMAARNQFAQQQAERQQQTGMQNLAMQGQYGLRQGDLDLQQGQFNTGLASQWGLQQGQSADAAARYGADAQNQAAIENARLQEAMYGRQLQSAGLYGDLASQWGGEARSDLGLQAQLGEQQRDIYQQYLNAIPTQLQMGGQLYGNIPTGAYLGQSGTQTMSGGLVGDLLKAGVGGLAQGIGGNLTFGR